MNAKLLPSCMDDSRIRVNVSRTPNELAIAYVMRDRENGAELLIPVTLPINNEQHADDPPWPAAAPCTATQRAEQLCMTLILLLLKALAQGYTGNDPFVRHMTLALFAMCRRQDPGEPQTTESVPGGLKSWQRALAMQLLGTGTLPAASLDEAAGNCGLSTAHFCRAFTKSFGLPPYRWVLTRRLERARMLLAEPQRSLADIAYECGFCDQSHLSHAFSRQFGLSPGAWRRRQRASCDMQPVRA
jgi:AraC-like DNA-binding protein